MNKNVGIWIDSEKAFIISMLNGKANIAMIESSIDHYHIHGGYGSSKPYLSQDTRSEKKLNEKNKHQKKSFFQSIVRHVARVSSIVIYGPASTKDDLAQEMHSDNNFSPTIVDVLTVDSMTQNQLKAMVRDYFKKNQITL